MCVIIVCKLRYFSADGISVEIVDLRTVYPLDKETIIERAKMNGKILLITEDNLEGSVMSEVSAIIAENCLFELDAPIMRLAGPDVQCHFLLILKMKL